MSYYRKSSAANSRDELLSELERVCQACNTTLAEVEASDEASDDPDVATPSQVVAVSLQYERDQREQACEEVKRLYAWLHHIEMAGTEGRPAVSAEQLRRWAYEAYTLGRSAPSE